MPGKTTRSSNLELLRILCMLLIIGDHLTGQSGIADYTTLPSSFAFCLIGCGSRIACSVFILQVFDCGAQGLLLRFVQVTGQQGRPDAHMQDVQTSGLVRIGAHVGMFAAGDDLQGLHGHMGEIFQAQASQGLEHGIVFLPGTCQTGAQQLRRKGPAHANAGKTFAHPGVELAQRATPLGAARTVGDQQDSCFHPCWCTSLAARWQDGGPHG